MTDDEMIEFANKMILKTENHHGCNFDCDQKKILILATAFLKKNSEVDSLEAHYQEMTND